MKKYIALKERIKGHVSKVVIELLNKEFNVGLYVPCSITYIEHFQKIFLNVSRKIINI